MIYRYMKTHQHCLYCLPLMCLVLFFGACQQKDAKQKTHPVKVETIMIDSVQNSITRNYVGTIEEDFSASLSNGTGGYVEKVYVHEGLFVTQGQVVVSLNKSNAQNTYNSAKASLRQAQDGYDRLKQVYDQGSLAEVKWVEMETKLEQAKSMEKIALKQLKECDLKAPFSGYVGTVTAQTGMNLLPMQSALVLMNINRVRIKFSVPENEISRVKVNQIGEVDIPALNNKLYSGKITERGVSADPLSHSYIVRIELPNSQHELLPGMIGKVVLKRDLNMSGYVIPANAIQTNREGYFVWIVKDNKATLKAVQIGDFINEGILIVDGLEKNDEVITKGYLKLAEGSLIEK